MAIKIKHKEALLHTIETAPHLEKIYLDAQGEHYFVVHEFEEGEGGKKKTVKYGKTETKIIDVIEKGGKRSKSITVGKKKHEITSELPREKVIEEIKLQLDIDKEEKEKQKPEEKK